ncbi:unnamed protein product, partial [Rotaria magnacalcarata]
KLKNSNQLNVNENQQLRIVNDEQIKSGIIELLSRFETLETNLLASSYDDLIQQQVNKYNHYRH